MIPKGSFLEVNDGFNFHFYDEGNGDAVVLLHGSGTGASGHTNFKNNFIYFLITPFIQNWCQRGGSEVTKTKATHSPKLSVTNNKSDTESFIHPSFAVSAANAHDV